MLKTFLGFSLCFLLSSSSCLAENPYEENLELFIQGNLEVFIDSIEAEKDFNWLKNKITLSEKNSELFASALLAAGEINQSILFLKNALKKYPKNKKLIELYKQLYFFGSISEIDESYFGATEKQNLKVKDFFSEYLSAKRSDKLKPELIKEIQEINEISFYLPSKLEYLLELEDSSLYAQVEKEALELLAKKNKILFPKSPDFYKAAIAYKSLAIIAKRQNKIKDSLNYFKLAENEINKIKSFWLEEDIKVWHPILKIMEREASYSVLLAQQVMALRSRFKL